MIEVRDIRKSFGKVEALKGVSLSVPRGTVFGLIGPDGAGKTSLIRILTTLSLADSGTATVMGKDVVSDFRELRKGIGYMPGRFSLYEDLTVRENLSLFASIFGTTIEENYELIREIYSQIEPFNNRRAGALSGGMKQKLALSCAMIHSPEVMFLDEPTTGVDPVSRKEFWHMLGRLRERGVTILVSTPYMDEAASCDRVALIQEGRILQEDAPEGIVKGFGSKLFSLTGPGVSSLSARVREINLIENAYLNGESVHIVPAPGTTREELSDRLKQMGLNDLVLSETRPGIEDCFLKLMKKPVAYAG